MENKSGRSNIQQKVVSSQNSSPQTIYMQKAHPRIGLRHFFQIHDGSVKTPHQSNNCWTHRWAMFTNTKALSMGAGVEGCIYSTFQPFSYLEIEQFIGLYILQGLNPSPKVDSKFHSQLDNPIQGNDL